MPFNWEDYLTFADEIKNRPDEAAKRIAISRAYYCIFNKALDFAIRKLNYQYSQYQTSHNPVWNCFENKGNSLKPIRDRGLSLKYKRETADYRQEFANIDNALTTALDDAKKTLHYLKEAEQKDFN